MGFGYCTAFCMYKLHCAVAGNLYIPLPRLRTALQSGEKKNTRERGSGTWESGFHLEAHLEVAWPMGKLNFYRGLLFWF